MALVCITNDIPDLRSCTVYKQHGVHCDGYAYRNQIDSSRSPADPDFQVVRVPVTTRVWSSERNAWVTTQDPCRGCVPRKADHGLLCWDCWEKVLDALKTAQDMVTHLRSVERAQQVDNAGVRAEQNWVLPVPSTWRLADELIMLLGHPTPGFPSDAGVFEIDAITERYLDRIVAEMWTATPDGAEDAVRFYLLMQNAMAAHPMAEYEHRIRNVRCYKCRQLTLLWKPPLAFFPTDGNPDGRVRVLCTNKKCDAEVDQTMYERLAVLEEDETKARAKKKATSSDETPEEVAS